ncbi:hypothetical protein CAOG_04227 [Capsaspora owczarzaki ATCC 30864]|uniref:Uncharacterized protein n=1 Tax=Capsaspora owczarzaki (strain ATCC 30864) TaxID=595528 RepID=A0A0D2X2Z8_CAPO3|nr:hypothetical protein CAOG_04227 [Capsaspora owczarzaki ATCC 30864]KJE93434.1 hypothetical protein CAOG_004227 [Capsaspora owczarzaki ATCC 30864]|eukprot:XP_004348052.1 hypothetical protein CAOG_04227 [Capsaspora owczarzaki ATCC 30864]
MSHRHHHHQHQPHNAPQRIYGDASLVDDRPELDEPAELTALCNQILRYLSDVRDRLCNSSKNAAFQALALVPIRRGFRDDVCGYTDITVTTFRQIGDHRKVAQEQVVHGLYVCLTRPSGSPEHGAKSTAGVAYSMKTIMACFLHELAHCFVPVEMLRQHERGRKAKEFVWVDHPDAFYDGFAAVLQAAEKLGIFSLVSGPHKFSKRNLQLLDDLDCEPSALKIASEEVSSKHLPSSSGSEDTLECDNAATLEPSGSATSEAASFSKRLPALVFQVHNGSCALDAMIAHCETPTFLQEHYAAASSHTAHASMSQLVLTIGDGQGKSKVMTVTQPCTVQDVLDLAMQRLNIRQSKASKLKKASTQLVTQAGHAVTDMEVLRQAVVSRTLVVLRVSHD